MSNNNPTKPAKHEPRSFPQHHPSRMDSFDLERELEALDAIPEEQFSEYAAIRADFIRDELKWRATRLLTDREKELISNSYKRLIEKENERLRTGLATAIEEAKEAKAQLAIEQTERARFEQRVESDAAREIIRAVIASSPGYHGICPKVESILTRLLASDTEAIQRHKAALKVAIDNLETIAGNNSADNANAASERASRALAAIDKELKP